MLSRSSDAVKFAARATVEAKPNAAKSRKPTIKNMCRLILLKRNREIICSIFSFDATIFRCNKYDNPAGKMFTFCARAAAGKSRPQLPVKRAVLDRLRNVL